MKNDNKARYDDAVKTILSDKRCLAYIMKYSVQEFKDYEVNDIIPCIENDIETGSRNVEEGLSNAKITGDNSENVVLNEGKVFYDIIFHAKTNDEESIEVIINIEVQNNYYLRYDIISRAIYYCSRMISSQAQREFSLSRSEYDKIKKVYSIWICMDVPDYISNSITTYKMYPELLYLDESVRRIKDFNYGRYNLQEIVIINLGKGSDSGNILQQFLKTLLSDELSRKDKIDRLKNDYGFELNNDINKELNTMCNLSDGIERKGIAKGLEQGIVQGKEEERKNNISCFAEYIMSSEGLSREEAEKKARDIISNNANNSALAM